MTVPSRMTSTAALSSAGVAFIATGAAPSVSRAQRPGRRSVNCTVSKPLLLRGLVERAASLLHALCTAAPKCRCACMSPHLVAAVTIASGECCCNNAACLP